MEPGTQIVRVRWLDVKNGDEARPACRSRYIAKEFEKGARGSLVAELFAALPLLSCSKFLLVLAACDPIPDHEGAPRAPETPLGIFFIDVNRAHFMGCVRRGIPSAKEGQGRPPPAGHVRHT